MVDWPINGPTCSSNDGFQLCKYGGGSGRTWLVLTLTKLECVGAWVGGRAGPQVSYNDA